VGYSAEEKIVVRIFKSNVVWRDLSVPQGSKSCKNPNKQAQLSGSKCELPSSERIRGLYVTGITWLNAETNRRLRDGCVFSLEAARDA